ncbi:MAG: DUF3795 domain-containing protein [Clostridiales bacterium]|nr:DUF3795 domain-containing protein [Clostridiales bacterium]
MKDFERKNLMFSLCGLNCALCPMKLGGYCPGCGGGPGNQSCYFARCSLSHGKVEYCTQCPEFPCDKYDGVEQYDSFITHQGQMKDLKRANEIGIDAYNEELEKKRMILEKLLNEYNDGRKKTFYCVVVNLLSLEELQNAMREVEDFDISQPLTVKEKAEQIGSIFKDLAQQKHLVLKLRKKT